jgi:hypothetical protein
MRGSVLELTLPSSVSIFPYVQGPADRSITTNLNSMGTILNSVKDRELKGAFSEIRALKLMSQVHNAL